MAKSTLFTDELDDDLEFDKNKDDIKDKRNQDDDKKEDKKDDKKDDDKKDDDDFSLSRDKKDDKKKPGKEDSIAELRKSRDEERRLRIEAENRAKELEKAGNSNLKPIAEYIEGKFGGLDEDAIKRYIDKNKLRKTELTEKEKKLAEKEAKLRHYTIEEDDEFQSKYKKPYFDAADSLLATIATVDNDGKIIQESFFKSVRDNLVNKSGEIDPVKAKAALVQIAAKYKEITGEDYNGTTLSDFMSAIREVNTKKSSMQQAYKNWEEQKTKEKENNTIVQQEELDKRSKAQKKIRRDLAKKAINEFNYDEFEGVIDEEEIENTFKSVYEHNESIFEDATKLPSYDKILTDAAKSRLFDKIFEDYKTLKKRFSDEEYRKRDGLKGSEKGPLKDKDDDDDDAFGWMGKDE